VLKEPYDEFDENGVPTGGGWSFPDHAFGEKIDSTSRAKAFQPICYINYGVWKGIHDWESEQMPGLDNCEEMRHGLRKIAYINVNKIPAGKSSPAADIEEAYRRHRDLLLDQINTYSPNILFACRPHANLLLEDFGFSESQWTNFGSAASAQISPERRLVLVSHPSQRSVARADYVNDAIKAATVELTQSGENPN
jgi:hypothetical protein